MSKLETLKEISCSCETCRLMCRRPCWGTPQDIQKIIDAGYGDRLMMDYWASNTEEDIFILCGALKGSESNRAPFIPRSEEGCTFWKDGLCELHQLKLKPIEGRLVFCGEDNSEGLHEEIYMTWRTDQAKEMVKQWKDKYFKESEEDPIEGMIKWMDILFKPGENDN